jgi:hypothetical protein
VAAGQQGDAGQRQQAKAKGGGAAKDGGRNGDRHHDQQCKGVFQPTGEIEQGGQLDDVIAEIKACRALAQPLG